MSNSHDVASSILRDSAGDIIVAGNTGDGYPSSMLLLKYSGRNGSLLWLRRLGGPANSEGTITGAAVDAHRNIAVTGYTFNGEDRDYYTAKLSPTGALLWARSYDGPSDDAAMAIAFDAHGNVVVTGGSSQDEWRNDDDDLTRLDYYTAKYAAADGALLWERRYNGPGDRRDQARAVAVDANDNVLVTGYSDSTDSRDYYTAKYAGEDGSVLWEQRYDGPGWVDVAYALALDAQGNVIVAGGSRYDGEARTIKYSGLDGTLIWEQRFYGPAYGENAALAVAVDNNANVFITGYSYTSAYTAKYAAATGALLWEHLSSSANVGQALAVDASGNAVIAGYSSAANAWNLYAAKYAAADGALLWERQQNGPRFADYGKAGVIIDAAGDAFVAGNSGGGYDPDVYTARLGAADGSAVWEQRYNGPSHRSGLGEAVVIDARGNVIVTGYSEGEDSDVDYLTLKYAPNGALLWERRYNGPANGGDYPRGVALDPEGNVIVTGQSAGGVGHSYDYYTAKYAAADGALLWEQRYNGPANFADYAQAVAVDRDGNVLVTGYSHRPGPGDLEFYTAKYAGSSGALQWERRFTPATGHAAAYAIAVDAAGDAVVTGSLWTGNVARNDFYTIKYAAADGQTLWERQHNSPDNGSDEPVGLAMDSEGNVLITGRSADSYTVKYAAATGQVLWEQRNNRGYPRALAVDPQGNAIVTSGNTYTIKYAAGNGTPLWERNIEGSSNRSAFIRALGVDAAGNVVAGGISYNGRDSDFFTAKFAAADGAILWEEYDDGPGHADDRLESQRSLALGPNGMVAITGSSGGFGFYGHDFTTLLYRDAPVPPTVNVLAIDPFAREPAPYRPANTGTLILHRSGSIDSALAVHYTLSGTAANGVDYVQLPGSVTIPAGQRFARIVVTPRKDSLREIREHVVLRLQSRADYFPGRFTHGAVQIFD